MSGCNIRLVFTLPRRDSTLQYKRCIHFWNNFLCITVLQMNDLLLPKLIWAFIVELKEACFQVLPVWFIYLSWPQPTFIPVIEGPLEVYKYLIGLRSSCSVLIQSRLSIKLKSIQNRSKHNSGDKTWMVKRFIFKVKITRTWWFYNFTWGGGTQGKQGEGKRPLISKKVISQPWYYA